ncbi:hypothetical protein [Staphylococcus hominis]|uniref:hypothetical protein n=1 Tax=Staphylococcus hominis TaxID=1290 RepID=UPI001370E16B|nr:hypothetical protein [Staphylococcus hominis]NAM95588.1 hypothetical protein [Staphylococcus hominis]
MSFFIKKYWIYILTGSIGGVLVLICFLKFQGLLEGSELLKIIISTIALFTTFGGAYFGAKISGENSLKLAKKQLIMEDLKEHSKNDRKVLNDINEPVTSELIQNVNNYDIPLTIAGFFLKRRNIIKLNNLLNDILSSYELSQSVYYPLEIYRTTVNKYEKLYEKIYEEITEKYDEMINCDLKNLYGENKYLKKIYQNLKIFELEKIILENDGKMFNYSVTVLTNKEKMIELLIDNEVYEYFQNLEEDNFEKTKKIDRLFTENAEYDTKFNKLNPIELNVLNKYIFIYKDDITLINKLLNMNYSKMIFKNEDELDEYIFRYYTS